MADKGKTPESDGSALWKAVTRDVKRLKRAPAVRPTDEKPAATAPKPVRQVRRPPAAEKSESPAMPRSPELAHGRAAGVDRRTLDRLRRGQLPIEAEIDLHGHRQDEAHRALTAFVLGQAEAGRRVVRIVTGKGSMREGGGVLKDSVPRWLNEAPLRPLVLAFSHARRDDGGEGALYVLLRRRREGPGAPR